MAGLSTHDFHSSLVSISLPLKNLLTGKDRQEKYDYKDGDEQEEEESGDVRSPCGDTRESEQSSDDCDHQEYCSPL
jgi:hypothetical protein